MNLASQWIVFASANVVTCVGLASMTVAQPAQQLDRAPFSDESPFESLSVFPIIDSKLAQVSPAPGVTEVQPPRDPVEETIPRPFESLPPLPVEPPQSPPDPNLQVPSPQPSQPTPDLPDARFQVNRIEVVGNTVLHDEINALVAPLENRDVTFEELVELRSQITQLYISNGYITSGAFIPNNQDLSSGVVQIQIVEGELEQINISGLTRLQESYVRSRLNRVADPPLNQQNLERALQLLQLDPLLEQVDAELTAGNSPGQSILQVNLREAPPLTAGIIVDNYQSPSIGSEEASVFGSFTNILGLGDRLSAQYGITRGLDLYDVSYLIPVNSTDGTLILRYGNNGSIIIEDEFEDLDIRSNSETFTIGFRQPLYRTPLSELALGLGVDVRRSQTFILDDEPFSFSEGAEDGKSRVTVLRLYQDWVDRNATRVLAARSEFRIGLDLLDATVNDSGTDGRFVSWLGQFQWVEQFSPGLLLVSRLNAQLSPDSLLSLERFSVGGIDTVRGYAQNELVTDNGLTGSVELRIPLLSDVNRLQLIPFIDAGHAWNNRTPDPEIDTLVGVGLGLRWLITPDLDLRIDYGIPLVDIDNEGNSLQENGLYFSLRYQPF